MPNEIQKRAISKRANPMYAEIGSKMVKKMIDYDIMDIMFRSYISPDGGPEEIEIARVLLAPYKEKWNSVVKD